MFQLRSKVQDVPMEANLEDMSEPTLLKEESRSKKDVIEKEFGQLETDFLKNAQTTSNGAIRSRSESIKLIYGIQKQDEWLDLINGHDEHVRS